MSFRDTAPFVGIGVTSAPSARRGLQQKAKERAKEIQQQKEKERAKKLLGAMPRKDPGRTTAAGK